MFNILFICTGNTCRSPMAAAIAKLYVGERDIQIDSAGVFAGFGASASENSIKALNFDKNILEHKAKQASNELMEWADVILVMTKTHLEVLSISFTEYKNKTFLLNEFADIGLSDISDPFGQGLEEYELVKTQLENAIKNIIQKYDKGEYE